MCRCIEIYMTQNEMYDAYLFVDIKFTSPYSPHFPHFMRISTCMGKSQIIAARIFICSFPI